MPEIVRVPDIEVADWQSQLGAVGSVVEGMADIDQCVLTILMTPKGSVPMHPEFGSDVWKYVDWPIEQARPHVIREIVESIGQQEPRVEIVAVTYGPGDDVGSAIIEITRRRRGSAVAPSTLVLQVQP